MSLDAPSSNTTMHKASQILDIILTHILPYQPRAFNAAVACTAIWILLRWLRISRRRARTTQLRGPPSESFLYGVGKALDAQDVYEAWAQQYGRVYAVPSSFGSKTVVLYDPKAVAHFHANETWTYVQSSLTKMSVARFYGTKGLAYAQGEDHQRQRRSLTLAFSIPAIRQMTPIFYDLAYKVKEAWSTRFGVGGHESIVIDIQKWMNHVSLDSIGLAGFSHNFGALDGKRSDVTDVFDQLAVPLKHATALESGVMLLGMIFPCLAWLPTGYMKTFDKLNVVLEGISNVLLTRTRKEMELGVGGGKKERSIIGLLIKGASADSQYHLTHEEIVAQMKMLLFAAYDTTAITLTWALLELARNPNVQTRLRNELLEHRADPTYDKLANGFPYLDAVVHETLRMHPPVTEFTRVAAEDDIIPLSEPIRTPSGRLVNNVTISKGTSVYLSIESINRSVAFWGEDAKTFRPSRWLDANGGVPASAKEIQGYRHLLTFSDGQKACLGRTFAVTEVKVVLAVLVRHFTFEMRDGLDAKIGIVRGLFPRPTIVGEDGCKVPLCVRPYAA